MTVVHTGGCFCGAVRYRVEGPPLDAGYCHCRMCQRANGAPAVAWVTWNLDRFAWQGPEPATLEHPQPDRNLFPIPRLVRT